MRQLFTYWPPRIVSAKCTFQLSRSSCCPWPRPCRPRPLPYAPCQAAICRSNRPRRPHWLPRWRRAVPHRPPRSPGRRRYKLSQLPSEDPEIGPDPHRAESDVEVSEADREKAEPCKELVLVIQRARARVGLVADRMLRHFVMRAARDVAHDVAPERVAAEEHDIHREEDGAGADAEFDAAGRRIRPPQRLPDVIREHDEKD